MKRVRLTDKEVLTWCNRHGITSVGRKSDIAIARLVMEAKDAEFEQRSREKRRELESAQRDLELIYGRRCLRNNL